MFQRDHDGSSVSIIIKILYNNEPQGKTTRTNIYNNWSTKEKSQVHAYLIFESFKKLKMKNRGQNWTLLRFPKFNLASPDNSYDISILILLI